MISNIASSAVGTETGRMCFYPLQMNLFWFCCLPGQSVLCDWELQELQSCMVSVHAWLCHSPVGRDNNQ